MSCVWNAIYGTNHPQLKRSTRVTLDTRGVNHTHLGFSGSTRVYTYAVLTLECVFTHLHACMANVASILASYLPTSLSYNATVLITLFFPYRVLAAH